MSVFSLVPARLLIAHTSSVRDGFRVMSQHAHCGDGEQWLRLYLEFNKTVIDSHRLRDRQTDNHPSLSLASSLIPSLSLSLSPPLFPYHLLLPLLSLSLSLSLCSTEPQSSHSSPSHLSPCSVLAINGSRCVRRGMAGGLVSSLCQHRIPVDTQLPL